MLRIKSLSLLRSHARRSLRSASPSVIPSSSSSSSASIQRRAFSSSASGSSPSPSPSEKPHWSGINTYYMSMRGLGIASRVVSSMPDFFRFYEGDVFAKHVNDDARSAMFVLTQFPSTTRVDLLEFRDAAEQLVHTIYEQMYAAGSLDGSALTTADTSTISEQSSAESQDAQQTVQNIEDPLWYLSSITSDDRCAEILKHKAALQAKRLTPGNNACTPSKRVILEQLSVNRVAIAAVDYKSVRYSDEEIEKRGYEEEEWLEIQVQYDVTEHLQLTSVSGNGIDDRKTVNTTFTWTFESNVTLSDQVEWQIVDATPFTEKSALLTSAKAAEKAKEEKE